MRIRKTQLNCQQVEITLSTFSQFDQWVTDSTVGERTCSMECDVIVQPRNILFNVCVYYINIYSTSILDLDYA